MCCMQVRPLNADYTSVLAKDGEFFGIAAKNPILFTTILVPLPLTAVLVLETWKRLDVSAQKSNINVASGWISVIYYLTGKLLVWHDSLRIRCVRLQQRYALLLRFFVSYCFLYCIWLFLAS
jgi:hypothetical protein